MIRRFAKAAAAGMPAGLVGLDGYSRIRSGPAEYVGFRWRFRRSDDAEADFARQAASKDATLVQVAQAVQLALCTKGRPALTLLLGPKGAGRSCIIEEVAEAENTLALDLGRSRDEAKGNTFENFSPGEWLYRLYYFWKGDDASILHEVLQETETDVLLLDGFQPKIHSQLLELDLSKPHVVLNMELDSLAEAMKYVDEERFAVHAIRVGDPLTDEAKESRLEAVFDQKDADIKVFGFRFTDLVRLKSFLSIKFDEEKPEMDFAQALSRIVGEKEELLLRIFRDGTKDPQVKVWLWDVLQILCGCGTQLTDFSELASSERTKNSKQLSTVLPDLQETYVGDPKPGLEVVKAVSEGLVEFRDTDLQESVPGPLVLSVTEPVVQAFQEVYPRIYDEMDPVKREVHFVQDLTKLASDMRTYFLAQEMYFQAVDDLVQLIYEVDDPDCSEVLHSRIDLEAVRKNLDSERALLLKRYNIIKNDPEHGWEDVT